MVERERLPDRAGECLYLADRIRLLRESPETIRELGFAERVSDAGR